MRSNLIRLVSKEQRRLQEERQRLQILAAGLTLDQIGRLNDLAALMSDETPSDPKREP